MNEGTGGEDILDLLPSLRRVRRKKLELRTRLARIGKLLENEESAQGRR